MAAPPAPRILLILERSGDTVALASWGLTNDSAVDVTPGVPGIATALGYCNEYAPDEGALPPMNVTSVFGRTGAVIAVINDYVASLVGNDSGVPGATVKAALDALGTAVAGLGSAIGALAASDIGNDSAVAGATVKDALDALAAAMLGITVRVQIPNPGDDATGGFAAGDQLYSTAAQATYLCVDATAGAAVWRRTNRHDKRNLWHISPDPANIFGGVLTLQPPDMLSGLDLGATSPAPVIGGSLRASMLRTLFTGPGAGAPTGLRSVAAFARSSVSPSGGAPICECVFTPTSETLQVSFFGFAENEILQGDDMDALVNVLGFGVRAADTTLHLAHNDGAGATTWLDLGVNFPAGVTDAVYRGTFYWKANDAGSIGYLIERLDVPAFAAGVLAAELPTINLLLKWIATTHGGMSGAPTFDLMYMEADAL